MDLRSALHLKPTRRQMLEIVDYVGNNKARFKQLVNVFLAGPYRITQYAAWPLSYCVEHNPQLVYPHLPALLALVQKPGVHDAVKRNVIRLLQFVDIPKRLQGRVANTCYAFLHDRSQPIAVRVFSMTVLANLAAEQPALANELRVLIEDELPYAGAAFRSRGVKVLRVLRRQEKL